MKFSTLAFCVAAASSVAARPSSKHVVHEKRDVHGAAWTKAGKAERSLVVPVRIGMTQSNLDQGHDMLMDISRHDSPNYAKYYTEEEVHDFFAPSDERVGILLDWLEEEGVTKDRVSKSYNKQWLQFDAPLEEIERLFKAEFHVFEHDHGRDYLACDEYSLPEHITEHVDYVTPGVHRLPLKRTVEKRDLNGRTVTARHHGRPEPVPTPVTLPSEVSAQSTEGGSGNLALCDSVISPACIFHLYGVPEGTKNISGNELGIFETGLQFYAQADLNNYFARLYPKIPQGTNPIFNPVDGSPGPNNNVKTAGGEATLDVEVAYPLHWPQNQVVYQVDDAWYQANGTNYNTGKYLPGFMNTFLDAIDGSYCTYQAYGASVPSPLDPTYPNPAPNGYKGQLQCGVYKPTNVISVSYGEGEADLPAKYFKRQCDEYMKLSMQGVSVLIATGDYGVASFPGDGSPNGCLPLGKNPGTIFSSQFPNACPYIVNIGSTELPAGSKAKPNTEIATVRFGSSGGFSNVFPVADYQKAAVANYLNKYPPPYASYNLSNGERIGDQGGVYNRAGRGFPDVSALGDHILLWLNGKSQTIGGTSASCPIFAALLTRINGERLAVGKKPIGFPLPVFYAHPEAFYDVVQGTNPGCGTSGFSAAPGWDPVTGLGTPNYPKLLNIFLNLP